MCWRTRKSIWMSVPANLDEELLCWQFHSAVWDHHTHTLSLSLNTHYEEPVSSEAAVGRRYCCNAVGRIGYADNF